MIEVLEFIFASFWRWLGAFLMLLVIAEGISGVIGAIARRVK